MIRYILPNHKSVRLAVLQIELYKHSWSFCSGFDSHVIHVLVQLVLCKAKPIGFKYSHSSRFVVDKTMIAYIFYRLVRFK